VSPMISRPLKIELALLGYLRPGPMHGYQIYQQLCNPAGLGRVWYLKQAQLYALLGKLEEAGFITSSIQQQATRPARRVFRLTTAGQAAFQNWLDSPVQRPRQMRQEFQAKLYFAHQESREVYQRLIASQRQTCQQWLANQEAIASEESASHNFNRLVVQYRIGQIQAMLAWLDLCGSFPG
jgi:PadR family transcriptional regulator AphA